MTYSERQQNRIKNQSVRGFAVIIALTLLSFLLILALAMSTLVRVEVKASQSGREQELARQNALFGLNVAIGELQRTVGPDTRVSARAQTLVQDPRMDVSAGDLPAGWSPKAWWVGVVDSDGTSRLQDRGETTPVVWLVSGLKNNDASALVDLNPFQEARPIPLFDIGSLDLEHYTDSAPIEAGRVPLFDSDSNTLAGSFAWIVDDEGMKAQLALEDPLAGNDPSEPLGGGVLPGAYDIAILDGMDGLQEDSKASLNSLSSLADLPLLGADAQIAANKRFGYTTESRGVLADVQQGGLKRDLTIAFERDAVFDLVFDSFELGRPKLIASNFSADPLRQRVLMEREKLIASDDLLRGGYIHWEVFKDYYNLKRFIMNLKDPVTGEMVASLDPTLFNSEGFKAASSPTFPKDAFHGGGLGPHEMASAPGDSHPEHPYGDFLVAATEYGDDVTVLQGDGFSVENPSYRVGMPRRSNEYRHSPITPVLSLLQVNSWLEKRRDNLENPGNIDLFSKVQVWTSLYNPYNIGIDMTSNYVPADTLTKPVRGPFLINYPSVQMNFGTELTDYLDEYYTVVEPEGDRSYFNSFKALENAGNAGFYNLSSYAEESVMLLPGRSHVMTRTEDISTAGSHMYSGYTDDVADSTLYGLRCPASNISSDPQVFEASVVWESPAMMHGLHFRAQPVPRVMNSNGDIITRFIPSTAQLMFTPFAWDRIMWTYATEQYWRRIDGKRVLEMRKGLVPRPGKILRTSGPVLPSRNTVLSAEMRLRTTKEPGDTVPPLAIANVRAMWCNPRWDFGISSATDSPTLAAYSVQNEGETFENRVQMLPGSNGRGYSYWGAGRGPSDGYDRVILFDVPRVDLVSLGQLQHANAGRFSYEPSYIVGNSYPNPRIQALDQWSASVTDRFSGYDTGLDEDENWGISGSFNLYDASYLVNEYLWDSFIFTTIPQVADDYAQAGNEPSFEELLSGEASLPNPRYMPYVPKNSQFSAAVLQDEGDEVSGSYFHNAGHLMVDGAFNVNSTSVDAWEAFLSGTYKLPVQKMTESGQIDGFWSPDELNGVRFPRVQMVLDNSNSEASAQENYDSFWTGFRTLEQPEVRRLAEEIVKEVLQRGPFLSLGDFVNRKLEDSELGEAGVLQAALDRVININIDGDNAAAATHSSISGNLSQAAGFPGYLQQGDILQALSPYMSVRSDSFTIRTYGEVLSPTTGKVLARAWCEATVQRLPDPVMTSEPSNESTGMAELVNPTSPFGRQFRITKFRWLDPDEV